MVHTVICILDYLNINPKKMLQAGLRGFHHVKDTGYCSGKEMFGRIQTKQNALHKCPIMLLLRLYSSIYCDSAKRIAKILIVLYEEAGIFPFELFCHNTSNFFYDKLC